MMITGKIYSMHDPEGKSAIRIGDAGDGWSLVLVVTLPMPTFPGLDREEHIFAGDLMVHEAKDIDSIPAAEEIANLQYMIYVKNS